MLDSREETITQTVVDRMRTTADPRLRQIGEAVVRHLHALVREVEPTQEEWRGAIDFLTATGQMCSETRQEFILLSDALGISMLVDAVNHRHPQGATETTVLGPFYVEGPQPFDNGADIAGGMTGVPMLVRGSVATAGGAPLAGATVDVWHADDQGFYDVQHRADRRAGRGRLRTDTDGRFCCWTIQPVSYPIPHDGPVGRMLQAQGRHPYRPAHVHFMIAAPGCRTLVTHLFLSGDPYLTSDVVFGVKDSIVVDAIHHPAGTAPDGREMVVPYCELAYDFRLAPARS